MKLAEEQKALVGALSYDQRWHAAAVKLECARIEQAARESREHLKDSPSGSGHLREAMLVAAIASVRIQHEGASRSDGNVKPSLTVGLNVAVAAAQAIVTCEYVPTDSYAQCRERVTAPFIV